MFRNPLTDGIVVLIVLLLFFGPKRLPMLSRSIGESIKEFRGGVTSGSDEDKAQLGSGETAPTATQPPAAAPAQPAPAAPPAVDAQPTAPAPPRETADAGADRA